MEVFYGIVGLVICYSWVHSIVIVGKKLKGTTQYETVVLVVALTALNWATTFHQLPELMCYL